jgi:hypothetical protein
MPVFPRVLFFLVASCLFASRAQAQTQQNPWYGSIGGSVFLSSEEAPLAVGAGVSGTVYLGGLVDDPDAPLALLVFLQHPSSISLEGTASVEFNSPDGLQLTHRGERYSGSLSGDIYFLRDTGLLASGAFDQTTSDNFAQGWLQVGFDHYFGRNVHLSVQYGADRGSTAYFRASTNPGTWSSDWGEVGMTFLLAHDHLQLIPSLTIGRLRSTSSYGSVAGPLYDAALEARLFLGRRWSLSFGPEVEGQNRDPFHAQVQLWAYDWVLINWNVSATVYVTDALSISVAEQIGPKLQSVNLGPTTVSFPSSMSAQLRTRF